MKYAGIIFTILLLLSCKKNTETVPPPAQKKYAVITTGVLYNASAKKYEAYYWKDKKRLSLPGGNSMQLFPYGMDKKDGELYIAGSYAGKHPQLGIDILMPCYWINGIKKELAVDALEFSERCGASDVKWFNGAWYILGDYDLKPVLWKVKGTTVEIIKLPALYPATEGLRKTSNLEVHNGKLYIGGNRKKVKDDTFIFDTGYWTISSNNQIDYHTIEDNLAYALSFFILPTELGIYVSGEYSNENGNSKPAIWSPGGRIAYLEQLNPSYNRVRSIAMNNKKELFAALHNIQTYKPVLNKIQQSGLHEEVLAVVPAGARGLTETLAILNDQVAYSYIYELSGKHYAEIIFNDKKQELNIDNNAWANFHRTAIFEE